MLPALRIPQSSFHSISSSKCSFTPQNFKSFTKNLTTQANESVKITPIDTLQKVRNCTALLNRTIVRVSGVDSMKFLQNLTTKNLELMEPHQHTEHQTNENLHHPTENTIQSAERVPVFSLMLNSQGRVLFDVIIYPDPSDPKAFLIDADANLGADTVAGHLRRFKMRSKVEITDLSENYQVLSVFGKDVNPSIDRPSQTSSAMLFPDPRIPQLGMRLIIPKGTPHESLFPGWTNVSSSVYDLHRILLGVPEGPVDWQSGQSLPFEHTLEYLNGVSFDKGCYLGQELTARTHYTGVIRKYIMPLILASDEEPSLEEHSTLFPPFLFTSWKKLSGQVFPAPDTQLVTVQGQKTGKIHSSAYHVGLGMVRLEHLEPSIDKTVLIAQGPNGSATKVRVLIPHWWKGYLQESEKRKKIAEHYQG